MKTWSIALSFFLGAMAVAAPAKKYPFIDGVSGAVTWIDKEGHARPAKKGEVLVEKAHVSTPAGGGASIVLNPHLRLRLLASSELDLPAISWPAGEVREVVLQRGGLRWTEEGTSNVALRSDLLDLQPPLGSFVFHYDPKTGLVTALVVRGSLEFSAANAEEAVTLKAGQKVRFQGVLENNEIAYDVLLKGKKIPRGKLGEVQSFSPEEKKQYSAEVELKLARDRKRAEEKAAQGPHRERKPDEICDQPPARLNQCSWVCANNSPKERSKCRLDKPEVRCLRRRCDANGEWADESEVPKDKAAVMCEVRPVVRECDY